jgi:hypothetical protein
MVYEARTLTRLILHGVVSLTVIASFTFPALRDLVIESNEASDHCLKTREGWNALDVGSAENLMFVVVGDRRLIKTICGNHFQNSQYQVPEGSNLCLERGSRYLRRLYQGARRCGQQTCYSWESCY